MFYKNVEGAGTRSGEWTNIVSYTGNTLANTSGNLYISWQMKQDTGGNDSEGNPKYIQGSGDLDFCNGINSITPEFPDGIFHYVCTIELNSSGGYLKDGFKLGEIFTKYKVSTRIQSGATCMSSCSTAFLGGKYRNMYGSAKLMVHSPYTYNSNNTIECSSRSHAVELKNYYIKKIGEDDGTLLFDRTMKYCGKAEGWFLNKDAAKLFNITTS